MVYQDIIAEAKSLPLHEQFLLVEELLRNVRQSTQAPVQRNRKRVIPFGQLRGALKPKGPLPTDATLQDAYTEHLMAKYL